MDTACDGDTFDISNSDRLGKSEVCYDQYTILYVDIDSRSYIFGILLFVMFVFLIIGLYRCNRLIYILDYIVRPHKDHKNTYGFVP